MYFCVGFNAFILCLFFFFFPSSEDNQVKREDDALAKWVADPANTEWMESKYQ